ncbi:peptide-methionine (R)-S-oxide reductase MsrB [Tunturiibacter gelidoferens]|uniref:peptide-methionine (R)-S-oxide reductase n=1 Tax=Tunturiibacter gelidiferens TaxID=3069689 RepID=A0A9X0U7T9_9BACT|nr:peptide-methionine (R)-S-oxide reductase MsrB [Edaphobacter lichenicola]MBB5331342.1 peptide-methionine (R)-S-oxide reductase [Edaphobacter lichenicola]
MFDSEKNRDDRSKKMTRRAFIAAAGVAASYAVLRMRRAPGVEASAAVHGTPGQVTIVNFSNDGNNLGKETVVKVVKTDGEWLQQLGKNSFEISRQADTEMPYSGVSLKEHNAGVFRCVCCDTALFSSRTKFESGTGWQSFWAPIAKENVAEVKDVSLGMERTEVKCVRCEGHLGHVFDDGPAPTGLRYCMNSASIKFMNA